MMSPAAITTAVEELAGIRQHLLDAKTLSRIVEIRLRSLATRCDYLAVMAQAQAIHLTLASTLAFLELRQRGLESNQPVPVSKTVAYTARPPRR